MFFSHWLVHEQRWVCLPQTRFFYFYQKDIIKHPPETMV